MSVVVVAMGPNSSQISFVPVTDTLASVVTAISDCLVQKGWSVHDAVSTTKVVFTAPNIDGESQKYMLVDLSSGNLLIRAYESWNSTTHVGTNGVTPAAVADSVANDGVITMALAASTAGSLVTATVRIWATQRYAFFTTISAAGVYGDATSFSNGVTGVFEVTRDNPGDTAAAGFPPFVQINTACLSGRFCGYPSNTLTYARQPLNTIMFPRTRGGLTGVSACIYTRASTVFRSVGYSFQIAQAMQMYRVDTGFSTSLAAAGLSMAADSPNGNAWGGYNAYNITAIGDLAYSASAADIRGRICGIKFGPSSFGAELDTTNVLVDPVTYLADPTGVSMEHHVIATNIGTNRFLIPA